MKKYSPTEAKEIEDARYLAKALKDIDQGVPNWRQIARELERRFPEQFGNVEDDPLLQEDPDEQS